MDRISLNDLLSFKIDQEEKRLRLIVFDGNEELVCRKTDLAEIKRFTMPEKSHLFRGRLQLIK